MQEKGMFFRACLKMCLKFLLAVAILAFLIWKTGGVKKLGEISFSSLNWGWLALACVFYSIHLFVNAWRWHLLLKFRDIPCSLWTAVSLTMQSFFFSLVMPGGALGGDAVRAGFIAYRTQKGRKFDSVFTILMDRFTGMIGMFLLAFLCLPFAWESIQETGSVARVFIWFLLLFSAVGIVAAVFIFWHEKLERIRLFRWILQLADRISRGLFGRIMNALDSYRDGKKELFLCVAGSLIGVNGVLGLCFYCVCLACSTELAPAFLAALCAITLGNIAGVLPATPSGIGMRDYFVSVLMAGAAAQVGLDGVAPALLMTIVIIGFNLVGGIFFLFDRRPSAPDMQKI